MRFLLALGLGLATTAIVPGVWGCGTDPNPCGCSILRMPDGTYVAAPEASALESDYQFIVMPDARQAKETFTRNGKKYEVLYQVAGAVVPEACGRASGGAAGTTLDGG